MADKKTTTARKVKLLEPTVDYMFKKLFGTEENSDLMISLINSVLEGSKFAPITSILIF